MTYATLQDLLDRFGEEEVSRETDTSASGAVDETAVARALADADTLINGYVAGRYAIPLGPVPDLVKKLACDIARYNYHRGEAPEFVRKGYDDARRTLADIQAGRLVLEAAGVATAPASDGIAYSAPARVFSREKLKGF